MKRRFSVEEALDEIMRPVTPREMQESETSTSSQGESDVDVVVESDHFASSSFSCDLSTESGEDTKHPATEWTSKRGQVWFPTNAETTHYVPVAREIIHIIVNMKNLDGRRERRNWSDVEDTDLRAYIGLLISVGVYRSKGEFTCIGKRCVHISQIERMGLYFKSKICQTRYFLTENCAICTITAKMMARSIGKICPNGQKCP
ncbi:hypothetical protein F2P81_020808 [Scophthalmus maximus]|uniref:PiggyBac transposable element-derived protein domain-containing protein n=1 Tax=Scophthalmus maximus TaxID=52904 RepID=A0A6A4S4H7_SCOMX|nr:hypothetical protein F2P81_020808 [Scophthalmus maximus]